MKKRHSITNLLEKYWGLFFILFLWMIFSAPFFFKGMVPYPSTYQVNHFKPWSMYEKYWGPVKNGAMPDIIDQIYPWRHFTIATWKMGEVPLWNPNNFAGNPHLANFQSAVFSPINLLFFILPFIDAWSIAVLLQPLLAGVFTYLLLRELQVDRSGSVLAAVTFMFCGFLVVWMGYATLGFAALFLSLALLALERYLRTKHKRYLFLLSFSICSSLFSGHFQTSLYVITFTFLYLLSKSFSVDGKERFSLFAFFLLGIFISFIQLFPSIQFYLYSPRSESFNTGGGIPVWYLITAIAPDFFGNPVTRNDWAGYYAEWASFIGIIPLILACFAYQKDKRRSRFFIIFAILTLLLSLDSPLQTFIGNLKLPVLSTSNPSRIILLFSFCIAVLSGFGFEQFLSAVAARKKKPLFFILSLFAVFLLLTWVIVFWMHLLPSDKLMIAKRNLILPTVFFSALSVGTVLAFFTKIRFRFLILTSILLLFASIDSLRFAQKWMPFDPKNLVFPETTIVQEMKQQIGFGRVYGNLGAQVETYYSLPSVEGYDPLYVQNHGEFINGAFDGTYRPAERSVVKLQRDGKYVDRALDLLGVTIIFHTVADTNQSWAYPVWKKPQKYTPIYKDATFELYRNNTALPRAALFYSFEVVSDAKKRVERFYSDSFDFRKTLLLEKDPEIGNGALRSGVGTARILLYSPNRILIRATTSKPALLFLSDTFYPTWRVMVNGKSQKIYRADHAYRAVLIPQGESEVLFTDAF